MPTNPNPDELAAFQDCVERLQALTPEEKGTVVVLLFHYWVKIVLPKRES